MKAVRTNAPVLMSPCSILPTAQTDNASSASVPTAFDECPPAWETTASGTNDPWYTWNDIFFYTFHFVAVVKVKAAESRLTGTNMGNLRIYEAAKLETQQEQPWKPH